MTDVDFQELFIDVALTENEIEVILQLLCNNYRRQMPVTIIYLYEKLMHHIDEYYPDEE